MKEIVLSLILFLPLCIHSQNLEIKGRILDDSTNLAISFSTVALKNKGVGVATGMNGVFNMIIPKYDKNDSLEFKALGYKDYHILLNDFLSDANNETTIEVKLTPTSFKLDEIEVFPTKEEETLGTLSNSTFGGGYNFTPGAQVVVFIPNQRREKGIIKSISYFFTNKSSKPKAPFRIKVLEADQNGRPGNDLLLESAIVNAPKSDEWFTVNLEKYNLPFPENGYFAGLELIYTDKKYQFKIKAPVGYDKKKLTCQGPSLGNVRSKSSPNTWVGKLGRGWGKYAYINDEGYSFNYMIQSNVKYKE